jgi:hypothetical protein
VKLLQFLGLGSSPETKYFGSAYEMKPGEKAAAKELLGVEIELGSEKMDSLETIRTFPVLKDR